MRRKTKIEASLLVLLVGGFAGIAFGQPEPDLWPRWEAHDPSSTHRLDHGEYASLLERYLITGTESGVNLFRYADVSPEDLERLRSYVSYLEAVNVSELNRDEQLAYWLNLYNAKTLEIVIDAYPVETIRRITPGGGLLSGVLGRGPWTAKIISVEGEELSLDDVEHRILRPIWTARLIHYGVNCASIGCPNLQPEPFTGSNAGRMLESAAAEYVNNPRGARVEGNRLILSTIYRWYQEDFENSIEGVKEHLIEYAEPELARAIRDHSGRVSFEYDWDLNEPGSP
jgi:hypothetical protein